MQVIRDFFANTAFKDRMRYKAWRLFTTANKIERVYGDMAASDWWWKEMVSRDRMHWPSSVLTKLTGETNCAGASKRDDRAPYNFHRPDNVVDHVRGAKGIPCLRIVWQLGQGLATEAE
jgi:hypothetical protein